MSESDRSGGLRAPDYMLLVAYCAALFGISLVGGRPLSRHEGVLPETAREMLADHDWVIPKNGGRPWLESPPLPQWITVAVASCVGRCDEVWIVRIPPALAATFAVCLVAWMAAGWFGRSVGLLSGLAMSTLSEVTRYAWSAEDEIFLCALVTLAVALFVRLEFFGGLRPEDEPYRFFGWRPRGVLWFFVALGATNLAKGVIFGTVMALVPIAGYLASGLEPRRLRPYLWFWGWLAFLAVGGAWPLAAILRYPDVVDVWFYDQFGRVSGDYTPLIKPVWYYLLHLPAMIAPWTIIAPLGMWLTWKKAIWDRHSAQRFLWCWAILTPAVLTIPSGKHHHYLLHALAPWAVFTALALMAIHATVLRRPAWVRNPFGSLLGLGVPGGVAIGVLASKAHWPPWMIVLAVVGWLVLGVIFSWGIWHPQGRLAAGTLFVTVALAYWAAHVYAGRHADRYRFDVAFLKKVRATVPADKPLLINSAMGQLEALHARFHLDQRSITLHNLTFLLDDRISGDDVYVLTYASDAPKLAEYGQSRQILESERTWRDGRLGDNLALFRLRYDPGIVRVPVPVRISPLQVMNYVKGPYLGAPPVAVGDRRGQR